MPRCRCTPLPGPTRPYAISLRQGAALIPARFCEGLPLRAGQLGTAAIRALIARVARPPPVRDDTSRAIVRGRRPTPPGAPCSRGAYRRVAAQLLMSRPRLTRQALCACATALHYYLISSPIDACATITARQQEEGSQGQEGAAAMVGLYASPMAAEPPHASNVRRSPPGQAVRKKILLPVALREAIAPALMPQGERQIFLPHVSI